MPGQATAGQLQAAALSVRVIYQSASTAPCCVHMVFPLTRSAEQCYDAFRKVNSSAKECERTPNSLYHNKHRIILHRFPLSNNLLYLRQKNEKEISVRTYQESRCISSAKRVAPKTETETEETAYYSQEK